ncbi:MAG: hypothetical protein ACOYLB_08235 [Phototrophicaceae bacterium]
MSWRIHINDRTIHKLQIISKDNERILLVWYQNAIGCYDVEKGVLYDTRRPISSPEPSAGEEWETYLDSLRAPNGLPLPYVRTKNALLYLTMDGNQTVVDDGFGLQVLAKKTLHHFSQIDTEMLTMSVDYKSGIIAVLGENTHLYLYRETTLLGEYALPIPLKQGILPDVFMSEHAQQVFICDGNHLLVYNRAGALRIHHTFSYTVGKIACSPNGEMLIASDAHNGVLRVYVGGQQFRFSYQKFAVDLYAKARQLQLLVSAPTPLTAVNGLTIEDDGTFAFSMGGVVVMTHIDYMDEIPSPLGLIYT